MTMPTVPGQPQAGTPAPGSAVDGPGVPGPRDRVGGGQGGGGGAGVGLAGGGGAGGGRGRGDGVGGGDHRAGGGLGRVARQFAGPSGPAGHLVSWLLARGNRGLNRWLVAEVAAAVPASATVIELGCGPGIALAELLRAYPAARIIGADPSAVVLKSARRRNARALAEGRLTLVTGDITAAADHITAAVGHVTAAVGDAGVGHVTAAVGDAAVGDVAAAADHAPAELVLACHVLYFWPDPVRELQLVRQVLGAAGHLALGYQLRHDMPPLAQRTFPEEGFTLYDSDDQVAALLEQAGFTRPAIRVFGAADRPLGRLALSAVGGRDRRSPTPPGSLDGTAP